MRLCMISVFSYRIVHLLAVTDHTKLHYSLNLFFFYSSSGITLTSSKYYYNPQFSFLHSNIVSLCPSHFPSILLSNAAGLTGSESAGGVVLDNYLVFGAPREPGPSRERGTVRRLAAFIMHPAKSTPYQWKCRTK